MVARNTIVPPASIAGTSVEAKARNLPSPNVTSPVGVASPSSATGASVRRPPDVSARNTPLCGPETVARNTQVPPSFRLPAPTATNWPPIGLASPMMATGAFTVPSPMKSPSGPATTTARKPARPSLVTPRSRSCWNVPPEGDSSPVAATFRTTVPSLTKMPRTPLSRSAENAAHALSPLATTVAPKPANRPPLSAGSPATASVSSCPP